MPYVTWVLAQNLQVSLSWELIIMVKLQDFKYEIWFIFFLFQALGIFMLSSYIPMSKLSSLEEAIDQNLLATFLLVSLSYQSIYESWFSA